MFCMECGSEVTMEAKFCRKCGELQINNNNLGEVGNVVAVKSPTLSERWNKIIKNEKISPKRPYLNLLFVLFWLIFPYGSVQITLFGNGKIDYASTIMEPIFVLYAIAIVLCGIMVKKGKYEYATWIFGFLFLISVYRAIAVYAVEASFGTTIKIYAGNIFLTIAATIQGALNSHKLGVIKR